MTIMKKILLIILLAIGCFNADAQSRGRYKRMPVDSLPYMKSPELPAFNIRLIDSTTIFNTFNIPKGKPTAIFFFDPGCSHCHDVTEELTRGMDSLKNIQFYFITPNPDFAAMRRFAAEMHLANYPNIVGIGRDYEFFFIDNYNVNSFPDLALYDEHKMIVHLFEGRVTVKDLYEYTHKK